MVKRKQWLLEIEPCIIKYCKARWLPVDHSSVVIVLVVFGSRNFISFKCLKLRQDYPPALIFCVLFYRVQVVLFCEEQADSILVQSLR